MSIVASQLVGQVSIQGAQQAQATLQSMSSSSKQAQATLDQLQQVAQDVSNVVQNKFANALRSSQGSLQSLAQQAQDAGIDTSKLSDLQAKAAVAADNLAVAQDRAAAALQKAANITIDAASSEDQIIAAQNQASLAADKVAVAQNNAAKAMNQLGIEAENVSTAVAASSEKTSLFGSMMGTVKEKVGGFFGGIKEAGAGLLEFGSKVGMTLMGVQMMAQMFMGAADAAGKMIGDFQQQMTKLVTTAGEQKSSLKMVGDGILAMAGPTGTAVKDLGDAMYWVEGGGAHGAQGLIDLKIAAMGAKDENANLTDVTKTLMFTLNSYKGTNLTAAAAMNTLIAATGQGEMTLQGLSSGLSNVLPVGAKFGISLADITAGLATMTMQGDDAASAATHLRQIILALEAPAKAGASALTSIGLTTQQVSDEMKVSLPGAIELITDHLKNKFPEGSTAYNEALKNIAGGNKQLLALLETSGTQLQTYKDNVAAVNKAVKEGGNSIMGWSDVQQNFNFMVDQAKASVGAFGVAIGTALAPMLGSMIGSMTSGVIPALNTFGQWIINVGIPKIQQFGATLAPLGFVIKDLGSWFVLALKDIGPTLEQVGHEAAVVFGNIAKYMGESDQFGALLADFETLGNQIIRLDLSNLRAIAPLVQGALGLLGSILTGIIIPALDLFVFNLGRMYEWLNDNSLPAQIVKDLLIGIGVAIATIQIGAFVATIPALVAGFVAWAVAAGGAAIATIAATWPILAIGAAIAVTVAGIILAVQHWGDITNWLKAAWESTVGFFEGVWSRVIGGVQVALDWFNNLSIGFKVAIGIIAAMLSPILVPIAAIILAIQHWGDIVNVLKSAWGPVPGFFQGIWDNVADHSKSAWDKVQDAAQKGGSNLVTWWNGLAASFANDPVGGAIIKTMIALGPVILKTLQDQFAPLKQQLGQIGTQMSTAIGDAFSGIMASLDNLGSSFSLIWQQIAQAVQSIEVPLIQLGQLIGGSFVGSWKILQGTLQVLQIAFTELWKILADSFISTWKVLQITITPLISIFTQLWQVIAGQFMSTWKLLEIAVTALAPIFAQLGQLIGGQVLSTLQALGMVIMGVILVAIAGLLGAIVGLAKGLAAFIQGVAMVITGIIQVFSGVVQIMSGFTALIVDLCTGHFNKLGADLGVIWNGIVMMFTGVWNIIKGLFTAAILSVVGYVQGFVTTVISFFTNLYNTLVGHSIIPDLVNGIVSWFAKLPNQALSLVIQFKDGVIGKFNEISTNVTNTIHNMINGVVDHLNDGISAVENFVNFFGTGINKIADAFHVPEPVAVAHLGRIPHYASGTDSHPGGPAIVGERGRELVMLPRGAKVAPNHITEAILSMTGGKIPSYADGIGDIGSKILGWLSGGAQSILDNVLSSLHISAPNLPGMGNLASAMFDKVKSWALSWVDQLLPKFSMGGQSVNVPGNVASWIAQAMGITGVPGSWASPLAVIAMHESGGNPAAVNNWDSNAAAGTPSEGLFQTIMPTFMAHAIAGHLNILNPIDNAIAAIRYIQGRYGDVFHVPGILSMSQGGPYVGYANGGVINEPISGIGLRTGTKYAFGEHGRELVTPYVPSGVNLAQSYHAPTSPSQSGQGRPIILVMNNREVARGIMPALTDEIRYSVNVQGM